MTLEVDRTMPAAPDDRNAPMDDVIREKIASQSYGSIIDEAWDCDIISAHSDLIHLHNEYALSIGHDIEAKFALPNPTPRRLSKLLWEDYDYLAASWPLLGRLAGNYSLVEISGCSPNAHIMSVDTGNKKTHVICFRSPLLWFIHSAFSKMSILQSHNRIADCVPQHDHIMKSDLYSDSSLLAGFLNDIEVFFDQGMLQHPITPAHLGSPYNYCEQVEGARRFILVLQL